MVEATVERDRAARNGVPLEELTAAWQAAQEVLRKQRCMSCHGELIGLMVVFGNGTATHIGCYEADAAATMARLGVPLERWFGRRG